MPVELLQFGGLVAVIAIIALLWFVFVYKARRTGEGDGTPRGGPREEETRPGAGGAEGRETEE
ncbi:hypothetical protein [Rubrobacter aplysinae]|uniref:hypothetical protein n=1 Tax=Rubrobacter aplysinae TaxID=909625 RepID=UPI00128D7E9A|nr:hypothetical protein [Rubrobacter aplysinae]